MPIYSKYWVLIILLHIAFSSAACKKEVMPINEEFDVSIKESPDSVYITQSKIYTDTIQNPDSTFSYILKFDNPVILENTADPTLIRANNGIFYLLSTESKVFPNVPVYKSKDLINWYFTGTAFTDETRPTSFDGNIWAPDINKIKDKYVLYYSMSKWGGERDCGIGVAISKTPYGPFEEYAKLFDSKEIGVQNSIDPFYFEDDGENYLFWGSHHGIYGIQLSDDGLSLAKGAEKFQIAGKGGEGSYIHKRNGYYYLFVSVGTCCEGLSSTYRIIMGRSEALAGPYLDQQRRSMLEGHGSVFLQGNDFVVAPGHNSEFITDNHGDDWLLYHGYLRQEPELNRILFLDKVYWNNDWPHIPNNSPSRSSEIPFFEEDNSATTTLQRLTFFLKRLWNHEKK